MTFLKRAIADGYARITGKGKSQKITYVAAQHSERFSDPEEPVRAEFWAELIYRYEYLPERILFEKEVPRRVPGDWADLVVYRDDECKDAYIVIECKRDGISDAEFRQAKSASHSRMRSGEDCQADMWSVNRCRCFQGSRSTKASDTNALQLEPDL